MEEKSPETGTKKETRGVKAGAKRGAYQRRDNSSADIEALFKRTQALEDALTSLKGGHSKEMPAPGAETKTVKQTVSPEPEKKTIEDEDWI